jgi:UDP-N-acetylglucosamine 2-epimerase (non-hydrolysing)
MTSEPAPHHGSAASGAPLRLTIPFGTRPEIVKLAPVIGALRAAGWPLRLVFTGQHFDSALGANFLDELDVRPDVRWTLPEGAGARLGGLLERAVDEFAGHRSEAVLLLGDTFTVPVFCLAARQARIPVIHLEAGLRSFNETSMEEVNRKVAAATGQLHLAPTALAERFLRAEGVPAERIRVVGNTVIDILRSRGARPVPPEERRGVLVTAHRASTVDQPDRLRVLVDTLARIAAHCEQVTFPVHPRTRGRLASLGLDETLRRAGVELTAPLAYDAMLRATAGSRVVVTDSGGVQEEASWLGVPVVVLRTSTPRWEGVAAGSSVLVGLDGDLAVESVLRFSDPAEQRRVAGIPCPYGDGRTAERVLEVLSDPAIRPLLRLDEPDFIGKQVPR